MSLPKILLIGGMGLFALIGVLALMKKSPSLAVEEPLQVAVIPTPPPLAPLATPQKSLKGGGVLNELPMIDRVYQLFTTGQGKLPIVETVTYTSSVPWLKGRPAWIADYATHYGTSRHFIARSLNGGPDYFSQKVSEGKKFNVFSKNKAIHFYLLVDLAHLKMGFYYVDLDTSERVLLKTYPIAAGRSDPSRSSGCLTPLGRYSLGDKVAIYQKGIFGHFQNKKVEMIRVFGTRWIPFDQALESAVSSPKGYGIYGASWDTNPEGSWIEHRELIGKYETDGGIRMLSEDLEELYAIILTKPTFIEIVKDLHDAKLPGIEVAVPSPNLKK